MKTAAIWKENDPILETRKIVLSDGKTRRKIIFLGLDPPSRLNGQTYVMTSLSPSDATKRCISLSSGEQKCASRHHPERARHQSEH